MLGDGVRDYAIATDTYTLFPYTDTGENRSPSDTFFKAVWPTRTIMASRVDYEQTLEERGLRWFDHSMFFPKRFRIPLSIAFAFVATHNHFVLDWGGKYSSSRHRSSSFRRARARTNILPYLEL